ncbi:uncharacterized protein LOC114258802 [Camellia sinensis]|uniref:uncharacterized protein LOC114258802 n=1 Tax=Camellia sinensis TaxID=4442 RepID=UPI001035C27D|nr:uncharacterized protein LOC114258802 [Camellia sinensis]
MDNPSHIPHTASERRRGALTNTSRGRGRGRDRGRGRGRGRDIQNPTHQFGFDPRTQDSQSDMQDAGRIDHALQIAHPIIEAGHDASIREPDRLYEAIERMTRVLQGQQIDEVGPSSIPLRTYNRRRRVDDR